MRGFAFQRPGKIADAKGVKASCGACRSPFARNSLMRVGHRLLCPSCLTSLTWRETGEGTPPPPLRPLDLGPVQRLGSVFLLGGLVAKAAVYVYFFLWAAATPTGDAALRGVVFGDLFTWIAFSAVDIHFRRAQITITGIFELALLILFLNREALLSIPASPEAMAVTMGFFFGFVVAKVSVWGAQRAVHGNGLKPTE